MELEKIRISTHTCTFTLRAIHTKTFWIYYTVYARKTSFRMHEQKTFENNSFSRMIRSLFSAFRSLAFTDTLRKHSSTSACTLIFMYCSSVVRSVQCTLCYGLCTRIASLFSLQILHSFILIRKVCVRCAHT